MFSKLLTTFFVTTALTTVGLGIASVWREIGWEGLITDGQWARVIVQAGNVQAVYAHTTTAQLPRRRVTPMVGSLGVLSFGTGMNNEWRWVHAVVPVWVVTSVLLFPPALAYVRGPLRRSWRGRRNQCVECGYSLAGNSSGVCPECGTRGRERGLSGEMPMIV
jgi:hypothetical protein